MDINEIRNPFEGELIANGYRFFKDGWKNSLRGIQKRFRDDKGTRYFITGYHYNHHEQISPNLTNQDSYAFEAQFRIDKDGKDQTIDVSFSANFLPNKYRHITTLKEVEDYFEKMFLHLKADYYELT